MRRLLMGDAVAAARALLPLPEDARPKFMTQMLHEAHLADCCRKRLGRGHPRFGNGSLMAAASRHRQLPEPLLNDPDYLQALIVVLQGLLARQGEVANYFPTCAFPAASRNNRSEDSAANGDELWQRHARNSPRWIRCGNGSAARAGKP